MSKRTEDGLHSSTKAALHRAVAKSISGRYAVYGVNATSMIILARLFSPEVFGVVAAVAALMLFFQMLAEGGLVPALIAAETFTPTDRNGVFSVTAIIGGASALLFYAAAASLESFYGIAHTADVVRLAAPSIFFYAVAVVPLAALMRDQQFGKHALAGIMAEVTSTSSAIISFFYFDAMTALAVKAPAHAGASFALIYLFSDETEIGRPRIGKHLRGIAPLLRLSSYQVVSNILSYTSRNLDNVLVAKYLGAGVLGAYDKAYQLMRYPLLLLTFALTPAIQPVLKSIKNSPATMEQIHREFIFKLSLLAVCAGATLHFFAELIVNLVLGEQWEAAAPLIEILALSVPAQVVLSTNGSFFVAAGRADLQLKTGAVTASILCSAIVLSLSAGNIETLCWGLVIGFYLSLIQTYITMYRYYFLTRSFRFWLCLSPATFCVLALTAYGLG